MRILLLLNGFEGSQYGIEDGFTQLLQADKIEALEIIYFESLFKQEIGSIVYQKLLQRASVFLPSHVFFFHITNFRFAEEFVSNLRRLDSKPILIYDEGDMYGGFSKPVNNNMKLLMSLVDYVSVRGLGGFRNFVEKYNKNIIFTPHSNSLQRFVPAENVLFRKKKFVFVGNRVNSRIGNIRRLPGAALRERFLIHISKFLKNDLFIFGDGWNFGNVMGKLDFVDQVKIYHEYWFHVSFEHYPDIPYYFSDRLPIALSCGQIYISHYHRGYENLFRNCDFIYFYKNESECIDILCYLKSLSDEEIIKKSLNAKQWAISNLGADVVWGNLINQVN